MARQNQQKNNEHDESLNAFPQTLRGHYLMASQGEINDQRALFDADYLQQINYIKAFLKKRGYVVADAALDLMLSLKAGKYRNNPYLVSYAHEIDILLPLITSLDKGMLKNKVNEIERRHGAIELWICDKILHDIGEDFDYYPENIIEELSLRVRSKIPNHKLSEDQRKIITDAADGMETLTHYRKYTVDKFMGIRDKNNELLCKDNPNRQYPISNTKTAEMPEYTDFFVKKMGNPAGKFITPQVFITFDPKQQQKVIVVTAYGGKKMLGRDWNGYMNTAAQKHIFLFDAKLSDRIQNLSSPLANLNSSIASYDARLTHTEHLYGQIDIAKIVTRHYDKDSPLEDYIVGQDKMMGVLYMIGKLLANHHPDRNKEGGKIFDSSNLIGLSDVTSSLNLSRYLPKALEPYKHVPARHHPIINMLSEIGSHISKTPNNEGLTEIANLIKTSLIEHGGEDMKRLIDDFDFEDIAPYKPQTPDNKASQGPQ